MRCHTRLVIAVHPPTQALKSRSPRRITKKLRTTPTQVALRQTLHDARPFTNGSFRCQRCRTASSSVNVLDWLRGPCFPVEDMAHTALSRRPPASGQAQSRLVIGRTAVHATHRMVFQNTLRVWFCSVCGYYGSAMTRELSRPCRHTTTRSRG